MDVRLLELAQTQADVVAAWQLVAAGWSRERIRHHAAHQGWQRVFHGVYALTRAPLTRRQVWMAASLTTADSFLSHASAGACWGFRPWQAAFETIVRPGNRGPRRAGGLLICSSTGLAGDTTEHDGIRLTTPERTLIDLASHLGQREIGRATREAFRLKLATTTSLGLALERHGTRRGTAALKALASRYAVLPYARTRSDAEAYALEVLHEAGVDAPRVNIRIAGEEADLVWPGKRLIIEIDGPQYHQFADEDARKQGRWEAAGFDVRRISTTTLYSQPSRLVTLAT